MTKSMSSDVHSVRQALKTALEREVESERLGVGFCSGPEVNFASGPDTGFCSGPEVLTTQPVDFCSGPSQSDAGILGPTLSRDKTSS